MERGYDQDRLEDVRQLVDTPDSDLFDVLNYVLFDTSPKTRPDRAESVSADGMKSFEGETKQLLLGILSAYVEDGVDELATERLGQFIMARYGSVGESKAVLGDLSEVKRAFRKMQANLYSI